MDKVSAGHIAANMHKNYFDRAKQAIECGHYLEAVFLEYAAIEGRLEVICGLLGCPCNKNLPPEIRKDIKISARITCLKKLYKNHPACIDSKAKLSNDELERISKWTNIRNKYVHGLFKKPEEYIIRLGELQKIASNGYDITDLLYKEAKRLRYLAKNHKERMVYEGPRCKRSKCNANENNINQNSQP